LPDTRVHGLINFAVIARLHLDASKSPQLRVEHYPKKNRIEKTPALDVVDRNSGQYKGPFNAQQ
jgi:hypothetical protein